MELMESERTMIVTNDAGDDFAVRIVLAGERYGRDDCLVHDDADPLVEFYARRPDTPPHARGQFASRYCLSTLREDQERWADRALSLEGSIPRWTVSGANVNAALRFAGEVLMIENAPEIKDMHQTFFDPGA